MERTVKLIWDFRGPDAPATAAHFLHHLQAYPLEGLDPETGTENAGPSHSIAYMIVPESAIRTLRDALKPHRGVYVESP